MSDYKQMNIQKNYGLYFLNSPDGIFEVDSRGMYTNVNPSACRLTGYSNA